MKENLSQAPPRGLPKRSRLKQRSAIQALFADSASAKAYPLRLVYALHTGEAADAERVRMGFVASKRGFKRAVDRNAIKRRMREAYRLDQARLRAWLTGREATMHGMLIYTGRELPTQRDITKAWTKLLRRLDPEFFAT